MSYALTENLSGSRYKAGFMPIIQPPSKQKSDTCTCRLYLMVEDEGGITSL